MGSRVLYLTYYRLEREGLGVSLGWERLCWRYKVCG
jgi:hypothetical protein